MAKAFDDAEFDKENNKNGVNATELENEFGFPSEFPYEFDSFGLKPLNSPVESVAGSTETESSDEEDFFAGLTRRLSQASFHETRPSQLTVPISNRTKTEIQKKVRVISGSPQSTLSGIRSWSGRSPGSGDGSPNESSGFPSPNTTAFSKDAWDAIYAAAEQVAMLKMNGDVSKLDFQNRMVQSGYPPRVAAENRATQLINHNNLNQASLVTYLQLRKEQMLKQQCGSVWGRESKPTFSTYQQQVEIHNKGREFGYGSVKCTQPAWHPLQVKPQNQQVQAHGGSGSRPVLNGGSSVKRGCAGTGVFLPRQYVAPTSEPRKKTTCAPVIVPAKVIHALNLDVDDLNGTTQQRFANTYGADYNALLARRNAILMQQKLSLRREEAASYEIRLPQEWTY